MNPRGPIPATQTECDDAVFEVHCLADTQALNTRTLLQFMDEADDDGFIDEQEWAYIVRHVKLEHHFNCKSLMLLADLRALLNKVFSLVDSLRARCQEYKAFSRLEVRG